MQRALQPGWAPTSLRPPGETMRIALRDALYFALMLGLTDGFILADAVRLGATALELRLVVSLPLFVGAAGPALALRALRARRCSRAISVAGASLQACVLALAAAVELVGAMTPGRLVALACLYQLGGQVAGTALSTWLGDAVPVEEQVRFFARRTRRVHLGTVAGHRASGPTRGSSTDWGSPEGRGRDRKPASGRTAQTRRIRRRRAVHGLRDATPISGPMVGTKHGWRVRAIRASRRSMLCVSTYVAPSRIHGLGLYAAEALSRGDVVWRFEPRVDRLLTDGDLEALMRTSRQPLRSYVYLKAPGLWVLCGDDAVFMNHADDPSCDDPDDDLTIALRDIAVGEELTVDYRLFDQSAAGWLERRSVPKDLHR